jgi:hypothetical protein
VPHVRTEITEITTGLAMLGYSSLSAALAARPPEMRGVDDGLWTRIEHRHREGAHAAEFAAAWANGIAFSLADDGLRGRRPLTVEWKGPYRQPGYDLMPADLRIDHVYLVSCKYLSKILFNASPSFLFDRLLADRKGGGLDWYLDVAPQAYLDLYREVRRALGGDVPLPENPKNLDPVARERLRRVLVGSWPGDAAGAYRAFSGDIANASARRWQRALEARNGHEEMLWRLLRLSGAPYFVLGASGRGSLRLRIYTPWDWRNEFGLKAFDVWGDAAAGQPIVRWRAVVERHTHRDEVAVDGHVEIRWSHGRFGGHPEAKVYLDTAHEHVPGYAPLVAGCALPARQLDLAL